MPELAHPEVDEVESSRVEKLLAAGLVVFLLIGGFWAMGRLGSIPKTPDYAAISAAAGMPAVEEAYRRAQSDHSRAAEAAQQAAATAEQARAEYEFRREEYRVALERGAGDPKLAQAHETARVAYEKAAAQAELAEATRASMEARLAGPQARWQEASDAAASAMQRAEDRYQLTVFALRFGYALPLFAFAVWLWLSLRRRRTRYLVIATAFMGFAGIQAVGLVGQYGWYLMRDIGPIALSVTGSAVCVAGLVALKRWASSAKLVTGGRLRRGQCPYCGFPLQGDPEFCAGCGRRVAVACSACGGSNISESQYCRRCGKPLA